MAQTMTLTPAEIADMMRTDEQSVILYAKRDDDPLPLLCITGKWSRGFAFASDLEEWLRRNTVLYRDRKAYKHDVPRKGGKFK